MNETFWHEKNGLNLVDNIELLEDTDGFKQNLNLTYAVRDGIISHCGEIDENSLKPREEFIDLKDYTFPNQFAPYTWEACTVKIADKISYIGRDIEDAITLNILEDHLNELYDLLGLDPNCDIINNSSIISSIVYDLCANSSPEKGLCFSDETFNFLNKIKDFNYRNIYLSDRIKPSNRFFEVVLNEIYNTLKSCFDGKDALKSIKSLGHFYPNLSSGFFYFFNVYCNQSESTRLDLKLKNAVMFSNNDEKDFCKAILYYISGMTDNFAIKIYNEIIRF